jgi:hypothetical protein
VLRTFLFILAISLSSLLALVAHSQKDRAIVSDDFTRSRPRAKRAKPTGHSGKASRTYRLASTPLANPLDKFSAGTLQVGLTIWKLQRGGFADSSVANSTRESAKRVEADTQFRAGDLLRLTIESPRAGYLYVIDRDWFTDGSSGETNLIFPLSGDDNRLEAGKLIEIPAENQTPFKASPKANQAGELLTIIVTSSPLPLPVSKQSLPISNAQVAAWEARWSSQTERFEMNGGAGQTRTIEEQQAASRMRARQLTRDDPSPQTIYFLSPKNGDGLLFNLMLSYAR